MQLAVAVVAVPRLSAIALAKADERRHLPSEISNFQSEIPLAAPTCLAEVRRRRKRSEGGSALCVSLSVVALAKTDVAKKFL